MTDTPQQGTLQPKKVPQFLNPGNLSPPKLSPVPLNPVDAPKQTVKETSTVMATLAGMREQNQRDYDTIIASLRAFAKQLRSDLEVLERWLGT